MDQGRIIVLDTPEALKASVGKDRVQIETDDDEAAIAALRERFEIEADGRRRARSRSACPTGEQFVPRLFAELGQPIRSVSVVAALAGRRVHVLHRHDDPRRRGVGPERHAAQHGPDDEPLMATEHRHAAPRSPAAPAAAGLRRPRRSPRVRVPARSAAQRAARDQGRLEARADPLQPRPPAHPHLADAAVPVPVRARHGPLDARLGRHPRGQLQNLHLPRRAVHGGDVHRHVLGRLDRVGPRVRLPARDDGRAGAAQLDRARQVPRRRHRGRLPGPDRDRARRPRRASPTTSA